MAAAELRACRNSYNEVPLTGCQQSASPSCRSPQAPRWRRSAPPAAACPWPTAGSWPASSATPDPYALVELGRDLRPPDYATLFVRLALAGSELEEPFAVASVFRPVWLDAVAREHGVMQATLAEALATYAG